MITKREYEEKRRNGKKLVVRIVCAFLAVSMTSSVLFALLYYLMDALK